MSVLARLLRRIRYLLGRRSMDARMDEEMRFHIEMETEKNLKAGMSPQEARRRALVAFGGVDRYREATREARGTSVIESAIQDVGLALRRMRHSPVFTLTAVVSLAVGLAAAVVVLGLGDSILFRPLPVPSPDRLVTYDEQRTGPNTNTQIGQTGVEYRRYRELAAAAEGIADLAAHGYEAFAVTTGAGGAGVLGGLVSRNYFRVLGLQPAMGRFFEPRTEGPGAPREVVVSHYFWQSRLGGDPEVLGRPLDVEGRPHTVVGVAPEGFIGTVAALAADLWVPADLAVHRSDGVRRRYLVVFGRVAAGIPLDAAASSLGELARTIPPETEGAEIRGARVEVLTPVPAAFRSMTMGFLAVLLAMAVLVLGVAAANVGGMLLARSSTRGRETAIRVALGAPRRRLVRAHATDTLVVFAVATVAGIALSVWLTGLIEAYRPPLPVRLSLELSVSTAVASGAAGLMGLLGLALGIVTGLQATSRGVLSNLREGGRGGSTGRQRLRTAFVATQLAVTVVLLFVAGTFARTVSRALAVDPGLDPEGLVVTSVSPGAAGYDRDDAEAFLEELLARVRARPDIDAAASQTAPLANGANSDDATLPDGTAVRTQLGYVEGRWFGVAGTRIVEGRSFDDGEGSDGRAPVAVINRSLAERLWPGRSPLGRTFRIMGTDRTVVGVAEDGLYRGLDEKGLSYAFLSFHRGLGSSTTLHARASDGSTATAVAALREELAAMDPDVSLQLVTTVAERIGVLLAPQTTAAFLVSVFGGVAMLLAGIGVFGLTAYEVARRTREIGIRRALGAGRTRIAGEVIRRALRLAALGLGLGLLGSLAVSRLIRGFVFGVAPTDPWILLSVPLGLAGLTLVASWIPARRATRISPVTALRDG